jgi:KTSC domain
MKYVEFPTSTAVAWASYDAHHRSMHAAYREKMRVYKYKAVPPKEFRNLVSADSKGTYINRFIKPVYEYEEVTPPKRTPAKSKRKRKRSRGGRRS